MAIYQFKTNINCGSCIRSVTNFLNELEGVERWEVDTEDPDKVLTVEGGMEEAAVIEAVEDAGFDAESLVHH